jgi:hypothetical protein
MWEKLSISEKAAIRKLALGYIYDVPQHLLTRLVLMGLVERGPNPRLTEAGLQLHRSNPRKASGRQKRDS